MPTSGGGHYRLTMAPPTSRDPAARPTRRPGLSLFGAVAVALLAGVVGGAIDVFTGPGLRTFFAVCFVAGCAFAAATVNRRDLFAVVVLPPLVYLAVALVADGLQSAGAGGSWLHQQELELVTSLMVSAPSLLVATGAAAVIAVFRRVTGHRRMLATRQQTAPAARRAG